MIPHCEKSLNNIIRYQVWGNEGESEKKHLQAGKAYQLPEKSDCYSWPNMKHVSGINKHLN